MKFQSLKRLVAEDFDKDQQPLIQKLAFVYNPMVDQLNVMFNRNVDFNNLNQQVVNITTTVDSSGVPVSLLQVITTLNTQVQGTICINAINQTDSTLLTGGISITFTRVGKLLTFTQITGLPAGKEFDLTVILIG